jgi:transglutaminase-like putative cysteine protease
MTARRALPFCLPAFLACLLTVLSVSQSLGQTLGRAPEPDWVEVLAVTAPSDTDLKNSPDGVAYLLSDSQSIYLGDDRTDYVRIITQVIGRAGLEKAATVSFDFDPSFDQITLHRINVIRGGQVIPWAETLREEVFRRETQLEQGIIDGTLTAYLQIPDLKVGDIVDVGWTITSRPMIQQAKRAYHIYLEFDVPVSLTRAVVHWPKGWARNEAQVPERVAFSQGPGWQGADRLEWRREHHLPPRPEENVPPGMDEAALVMFSGWADWSALSTALTPYYTEDYPLPPLWQERLDLIAAQSDDPKTRALAALRLVQEDLRYVSLSVGAGGIFARLPQEVVSSGFGDCKDKALLLRVLLGRLGISADVALTDLDEGRGLPLLLPSLWAFDHAIVRINFADGPQWVDPTASYQAGDFETAGRLEYGFALPLTGVAQSQLEPIVAEPGQIWKTDTTETFLFTPLGVFLTVQVNWSTGAADYIRQRWANSTPDGISQDYLEYYASSYPGLTLLKPLDYVDDPKANLVKTTEFYFLTQSDLNDGLIQDFPFRAENFVSNLPDTVTGNRRSALDPGPPVEVSYKVQVMNAPITFVPPEGKHISNAGFGFTFETEAPSDGNMTLQWTFSRTGQPVPASQVAAVLKAGREVAQMTNWYWNLTPDP